MIKLYERIIKRILLSAGTMIFSGIIVFSCNNVYGKEKSVITNLKITTGEYIQYVNNEYCADYFSNKDTINISFNMNGICDEEAINAQLQNFSIIGNDKSICGGMKYNSSLKECIMTINLNEGENGIRIKNKITNDYEAYIKINYKRVSVTGIPENLKVDDNFNISWNIKDLSKELNNYRAEWYGYGINTMLISTNGNITIVNGGNGTISSMIYDCNNKAVGHIEINIESSGTGKYGWIKNNGKWYYIDPETKCFKIGWLESNNNKYYINNNGEMAVGWIDYRGVRYYLAKDGTMKNGWEKIDGCWYYFNEDGSMRRGWLDYNNSKYYFGEDGVMVTGSCYIDGQIIEFKDNGEMV